MERECKTSQSGANQKILRVIGDLDQADGFLGIRDLLNYREELDGQYLEFTSLGGRRDPEESHHNEAGQKVKPRD